MNPNPAQGLKGFREGYGISAKTLNAMGRALFHARGTNGVNVRWEGGNLVVEGSNLVKPFTVSNVSNHTDGWQILVAPGFLHSQNGTSYLPLEVQYDGADLINVGPIPVTADVSYVAVKVTCDVDEELDGVPEIVLIEDSDWYPVDDPFLYGFYPIAKITKAGDSAAPSITVNSQYIDHHLAHRKINTSHVWGEM